MTPPGVHMRRKEMTPEVEQTTAGSLPPCTQNYFLLRSRKKELRTSRVPCEPSGGTQRESTVGRQQKPGKGSVPRVLIWMASCLLPPECEKQGIQA